MHFFADSGVYKILYVLISFNIRALLAVSVVLESSFDVE